jgi:hypothetical protein
VKRFLAGLEIVFYILAGTITLGLAADFFFSIFLGHIAPWWFWLVDLLSVSFLVGVAHGLIRPSKKNRPIF